MDSTTRWEDARRLEQWAGEIRVNALRMLSIVAFYGHHLVRVYVLGTEPKTGSYHHSITATAVAWALLALTLRGLLKDRYMPRWLKYAVVFTDLVLVTLLLMAGGGPKSMLAVLYLVVVASSALRLSLKLVWSATTGALALYLFLCGWVIQFKPELRIAHPEQVVFMLGLLATGGMAGQMVRQARRLVTGSGVDVEEPA